MQKTTGTNKIQTQKGNQSLKGRKEEGSGEIQRKAPKEKGFGETRRKNLCQSQKCA